MGWPFSPQDIAFIDRAIEQVSKRLEQLGDTIHQRERIASAVLEEVTKGDLRLDRVVASVLKSLSTPQPAVVCYQVTLMDGGWCWQVRTVAGNQVVAKGFGTTSVDARVAALEAAANFKPH
jgi:hypothetical protein